MKALITLISSILFTLGLMAQDKVIDLWPDGPPSDNGLSGPEVELANDRVNNISVAKLYIYSPDKEINTGAALIILPGGSYQREAMVHEGYAMAEWFKKNGITGIVLKYRLPNGHPQIPMDDASQAIRYTRQHAKEWGINPNKIGICGSSAGGHFASYAGTVFDPDNLGTKDKTEDYSSRPDFMLLLYPMLYLPIYKPRMDLVENFYGTDTTAVTVKKYSSILNISADTPPTFLVLANNDHEFIVNSSIDFYLDLKKFNIPSEIHIFQDGEHGFGITKKDLPVDMWPDLFYNWLKSIKMVQQ